MTMGRPLPDLNSSQTVSSPGKWQPPFRPSQVLYSEFPEDRGRSLDIDRQDVSRKGYPYSYEPLANNRLPDDPPPRDYSDDYPAGGKESEKEYPDKDYPGYGAKDYPDYGDSSSREQPQGSPEYSSEGSREYYQPYNNYGDYKDEKSQSKEGGDNDADFTVEDFELDPAVMNPPPPLRPAKANSSHSPPKRRPTEEQHDEVHEPTEPPTTQVEIPATQPASPLRLPTPVPIQATGYPLTRTPVPVFRNPALSLMSPQQVGWGHWKNVLDEAELSNLQVMKPPPLGQAQTWRTMNNFVSSGNNNNHHGKRPLRYA